MDTSALSPSDAAVALRSFPRRFGAILGAEASDGIPDEVQQAPGPGGRSAAELLGDTNRTLALLERAFQQTLIETQPTLHRATMHRADRDFELGAGPTAEAGLAELSDLARRFAERVEAVPADDWARPATLVGGDEVTALDLVSEAVSTAADNLRELRELAQTMGGHR